MKCSICGAEAVVWIKASKDWYCATHAFDRDAVRP